MIRYFISYSYGTENSSGFSNMQISLFKPIRSMEDINKVADIVKEHSPEMNQVVVLSWQRFEEEEP